MFVAGRCARPKCRQSFVALVTPGEKVTRYCSKKCRKKELNLKNHSKLRSCRDKVRHPNFNAARVASIKQNKQWDGESGKPWLPYWCTKCGGWHIGRGGRHV